MHLVFDLDDCLLATRAANRAAYQACGVTPPPEADYWPASKWLLDCKDANRVPVSDRKAEFYPSMLRQHATPLMAMQIATRCGPAVCTVLTGASLRSVNSVRTVFPMLKHFTIHHSMTPDDKISWLLPKKPGIYFDDWDVMVRRVREETQWQAVNVSGL